MSPFFDPPESITVELTPLGKPRAFVWREQVHEVVTLANRWRNDEGWWREHGHIKREYFKLKTNTKHLVYIYHELPDGPWYIQSFDT